jgi:DNA (cytosine-5)-methyltransferase 1
LYTKKYGNKISRERRKTLKKVDQCTVVDVFAGVGGLTYGFNLEGFNVVAGIDADRACKYPYEQNNPSSTFILEKIEDVKADDVLALYPAGHIKVLVGCAPCQPFSSYTRKEGEHESWQLLYDFSELIDDVQPDIVSMENVPRLKTYDDGKVFNDFIKALEKSGYDKPNITWVHRVYAPDYGVPQHRYRLILLASKLGKIKLLRPSHSPDNYRTVRNTIEQLPKIKAGETHPEDSLHRASMLSSMNLQRIQASMPGGTWEDWDSHLVAACHKKNSGKTYKNVYGRMSWDEPSPTITTQCYGFGNGRFGHPEQDRAISTREAALLQTFPDDYQFFMPNEETPFFVGTVSRMIGNAVPVDLARVIAKSIRLHIRKHRGWLRSDA